MEIKDFQDSRNAQLIEFAESYDFLKKEYSRSLLAAINEQDAASQQKLISTVLDINSELSSLVSGVLSELNKGTDGVDPKTLDDLTNDLIIYQQQYQEIKVNKDKLQTLKIIYGSNKTKLETVTNMYNIYLGILVLLTFLVLFLVIRTGWSATVYSTITSPTGGRR